MKTRNITQLLPATRDGADAKGKGSQVCSFRRAVTFPVTLDLGARETKKGRTRHDADRPLGDLPPHLLFFGVLHLSKMWAI